MAPHRLLMDDGARQLLDQIRARGPLPERVAEAFLAVPRDRFVPPEHAALAWQDGVVPLLGPKDKPTATISQPFLVLQMLRLAEVQPGHRVLEIGAASGWNAGMLGHLAGPEGRVTAVEIVPELARRAAENLAAVGVRNVRVVEGDAGGGFTEDAPYDRVIYTASSPDLPRSLRAQVVDGGRVLLVLAVTYEIHCCVVLDRQGAAFRSSFVGFCRFVPLTGEHGGTGPPPAADELLRSLGDPPLVRTDRHWFGADNPGGLDWGTMGLRLFLALTEPGYRTLQAGFALVDGASVLICDGRAHGSVRLHGSPAARRRLDRALARWVRAGMPAASAWTVTIGAGRSGYALRRRETTFRWTLPRG